MSTARNAVKSFDASDDLSQAQKEALEALFTVAEQQGDIFLMEIMDSIKNNSDKKIPVTTLVSETKEIRAMTSKSLEDIGNTVTSCLSSFFGGSSSSIISGIGGLLSEALNIFLGESSGATGKLEKYYVLTNNMSVVRFDVKGWYRNIQAKSLYKAAEKVTCFVATQSIVDLSKIDLSTFLYLYKEQLNKSKILDDDMDKELDRVIEIYNKFRHLSETDNLLTSNRLSDFRQVSIMAPGK